MNPVIFNTAENFELENETVLLRPLQLSDYTHLLPFATQEPELWKYSLISGAGAEGLKKYIHTAIDNRAAGREYPFIVFDKRSGQYAGSTRFYDIQPVHLSTQLGFTWYGKNFQGTGLNKNCKYLLLEFAFEKMNMQRVEFRADNTNARSIAAMKSIGCTVEGVLRSNTVRAEGGRRDSIVLSILKNEWQGSAKQLLKDKL